jgi:hypothetical protein
MLALAVTLAQAQPSDTPPTESASLLKRLQASSCRKWPNESASHRSMGSHQTLVVTYLSPQLDRSMTAKAASHPRGAVAVKELLDAAGKPYGWGVSIKTSAESDGGMGWYRFETPGMPAGNVVAQSNGVPLCSGCHARGLDFVLTPHPLD